MYLPKILQKNKTACIRSQIVLPFNLHQIIGYNKMNSLP